MCQQRTGGVVRGGVVVVETDTMVSRRETLFGLSALSALFGVERARAAASTNLVQNIQQLRAMTTMEPFVIVAGYHKPNDGGGGIFICDQTPEAEDDGGMTFAAGKCRYRRLAESVAHSRWFGAKGDGESDDTASVQISLAYAASHGMDYEFDAGLYSCSQVVISGFKNARVSGSGSIVSRTGRQPYGVVFVNQNISTTFSDFSTIGRDDPALPEDIGITEGDNTACLFERLTISKCARAGLMLYGDGLSVPKGGASRFRSNRINFNGRGIDATAGQSYQQIEDNIISNNKIGLIGGFSTTNIRGNQINCNEIGAILDGALGSNADHASFSGNQVNHNTTSGLTISNPTNGWSVIDNQFLSNGESSKGRSLAVHAGKNISFIGNQIDGGAAGEIPISGGATRIKWIGNRFQGVSPTESERGRDCSFIGNIYDVGPRPVVHADSTGYVIQE